MYLLPRVNLELRPKLLQLEARHAHRLARFLDGRLEARHARHDGIAGKWGGAGGKSDIFFWVIPAKVAGTWRWDLTVGGKPQPYEVTLDQSFQVVSGAARVGGRTVKLQEARLSGEDLRFTFTADVNGAPVKHEFSGKVEGDSINGSVVLSGARVQGQQEWNARRSGRCRRGGSARGAFPGRCAWLPACPVDAESDRHGARGRLSLAQLLSALPAAGPAFAQEKDLDTPYVQTPQNVVDKMLEIAKIGRGRLRDRPGLGRRAHGDHRGERATARAASGWTSTGGWWS